jgi:hypothetical protein
MYYWQYNIFIINEYILSHGFLFRFIQANIANTESVYLSKYPDVLDEDLIRDPRKITRFIINDKLCIDYFIPDQFIPIYWASIWAIIINGLFAIYMIANHFCLVLLIIISSLFLILKFISYHMYKINQFINNFCNFIICHSFMDYKDKSFFRMPTQKDYFISGLFFLVIFAAIFYGIYFGKSWCIKWNYSFFETSLLILILYLLWFPLFGIFIHLIKLFDQCKGWEDIFPKARGESIVEITFNNNRKLYWVFWLLFTVM